MSINEREQRNRDIDREIQKIKEIAEQQQRQEEESNNSEYDRIQRLHTLKPEQLISLMNINRLGQQLALSIDTSAEDDGDDDVIIMDNDMISKVVELFQKLQRPRAEQRKRRWNNEEVPSVPTKKVKESDTTSSSANITDGVPVANAQPVEADPRVQPPPEHRVSNTDVAPVTKEPAPVQTSNNLQIALQDGYRLVPQRQIIAPPPPPRQFGQHRHSYGSAFGYSHGVSIPPSQPVYPRFCSAYNLPAMPVSLSLTHPYRGPPPPLPISRNFPPRGPPPPLPISRNFPPRGPPPPLPISRNFPRRGHPPPIPISRNFPPRGPPPPLTPQMRPHYQNYRRYYNN